MMAHNSAASDTKEECMHAPPRSTAARRRLLQPPGAACCNRLAMACHCAQLLHGHGGQKMDMDGLLVGFEGWALGKNGEASQVWSRAHGQANERGSSPIERSSVGAGAPGGRQGAAAERAPPRYRAEAQRKPRSSSSCGSHASSKPTSSPRMLPCGGEEGEEAGGGKQAWDPSGAGIGRERQGGSGRLGARRGGASAA